MMGKKAWVLLPILVAVLLADQCSKRWAEAALADGRQIEALDGFFYLTLVINRDAAFGLGAGANSTLVFMSIYLVAIIIVGFAVVQAAPTDRFRIAASSLVLGGTVGNALDRWRWDGGVVDFLGPINLGIYRFPIFNLADVAILCGVLALAVSFWNEERRLEGTVHPNTSPPDVAPPGTEGEPPPPARVGSGEPVRRWDHALAKTAFNTRMMRMR